MEKMRRIVIISRDLYEQIRTIAQREHRSLSAQIVHFLQEAVARENRLKPKKAPNLWDQGPEACGGLKPVSVMPAIPGPIGNFFTGLGFAATPFPLHILPLFVVIWVVAGLLYAWYLVRRAPECYVSMGRIIRGDVD